MMRITTPSNINLDPDVTMLPQDLWQTDPTLSAAGRLADFPHFPSNKDYMVLIKAVGGSVISHDTEFLSIHCFHPYIHIYCLTWDVIKVIACTCSFVKRRWLVFLLFFAAYILRPAGGPVR
jgi:hypothetical protein